MGGPKDFTTKLEIRENHYKPRKKGRREGLDPSRSTKKGQNLPAILRRCTSKSSVHAIESSPSSVFDKLANFTVLLRCNKVLKHAFRNGRSQTTFKMSNRTRKGTVESTRVSKVLTILNDWAGQRGMKKKTRSAACFRGSRGSDWWRGIAWDDVYERRL